LSLLLGIQYFAIRSYLVFRTTYLHKVGRNVVLLFLICTICVLARIGFMLHALFVSLDSTFLLGGPTNGWILFAYYFTGEVIPSTILIIIQEYMSRQDLNSEVSSLWEPIPVSFERKINHGTKGTPQ